MASGPYQDNFYHAVNKGDKETWFSLLLEKRHSQRFPLDLDLCLLDAVRLSCPAAVEDVLKFRPSLNAQNAEGQRAIHLAAEFGPAENIKLLVQAGSTLNCVNAEGWSPLHVACIHNNLSTAEALLRGRANKNAARKDVQFTPLHLAVQKGYTAMVQLLLQYGADSNIKTSKSHGEYTALTMAVASGNLPMLELVMMSTEQELQYSCDMRGCYPLHIAVECGSADCLVSLLSNMKQLVFQDSRSTRTSFGSRRDALASTSSSDELKPEEEVVMKMINLTDNERQTALHLAIKQNQVDLVRILLDAGSDVNVSVDGQLPLELALTYIQPLQSNSAELVALTSLERGKRVADGEEWDDAVVRLLCDRSVNLEDSRLHPIHLVLEVGLHDIALLLCKKAPHIIDCTTSGGFTPLHYACQYKGSNPTARLELVRMLLDMGLSVNARTNDKGWSPLTYVIYQGDLDLLSLLLEKKPDLSAVDVDGMTALHDAVVANDTAVMEALICAGANVNQRGPPEGMPLILAASLGHVEVTQCLLKHNADLDCRENRPQNFTALHRATFNFSYKPEKFMNIIELLVMGGADLSLEDRNGLNPLQRLICTLVCYHTSEQVKGHGFTAVRLLVEAGSKLGTWTPPHTDQVGQVTEALLKQSTFVCLAFVGLHALAYYLANVGWPLYPEMPFPSPWHNPANHNWMHLPGKTEAQDDLHAYLLLRRANPFSLRHLCRAAVHSILREARQQREIMTSIEKLPVPQLVQTYLLFRDGDYRDVHACWGKLMHSLPLADQDYVVDKLGKPPISI